MVKSGVCNNGLCNKVGLGSSYIGIGVNLGNAGDIDGFSNGYGIDSNSILHDIDFSNLRSLYGITRDLSYYRDIVCNRLGVSVKEYDYVLEYMVRMLSYNLSIGNTVRLYRLIICPYYDSLKYVNTLCSDIVCRIKFYYSKLRVICYHLKLSYGLICSINNFRRHALRFYDKDSILYGYYNRIYLLYSVRHRRRNNLRNINKGLRDYIIDKRVDYYSMYGRIYGGDSIIEKYIGRSEECGLSNLDDMHRSLVRDINLEKRHKKD